MNIEQALERVTAIDERLSSIKSFVWDDCHEGCHGGASVEVSYGKRRIKVTALFTAAEEQELTEAEAMRLEAETMRLEAERANLAAVIDMANAVLKGIGV